jgi:HAT1-interacting factor 1
MIVLNRLGDAPAPSEALKELDGLVEPASGTIAIVPGESTAERDARIKEAASKATDLSGLVRHKKKDKTEGATNGTTKRKADDGDDTGSEGKKVKFDV